MKWFNRLCYLVATEICMVRGKPGGMAWHGQRQAGVERSPPGREADGLLAPICLQAQGQVGHPSGTPSVTWLACGDIFPLSRAWHGSTGL